MTATIIPFPKPIVPAVRCIDPIDESLAEFRIAALRSEKLAEELEKLEREIADILRDHPRGAL